jgi:hypothetical protein
MAKFRKNIVKPSVYRVNTKEGKQIRAVSSEFLKEVCENTREMMAAGIKVPAPYAHKNENGIYPGPVLEQEGKEVDAKTLEPTVWSSDFNAGFWNEFTLDDTSIAGVLDSSNSDIGETIKDTSIYVDPEFTDGLGRTWKNVIRHVALVTNPVEPYQDNFTKIEEGEHALAMSFSMSDEVGGDPISQVQDSPSGEASDKTEANPSGGDVTEIVKLMDEKFGISFPGDTSDANFLDRLLTVLTSIPNEEEGEDEMLGKPKGSEVQSSPVIMANENTDDKKLEQAELLEAKAQKLLEGYMVQVKSNFTDRINALIKKGKIGKEYAEQKLFPAVEGLAMSLDDIDVEGKFKETPLQMSLDMLDSTEGFLDNKETGNINDTGGTLVADPADFSETEEQMSEEEAAKVYDRILNNTN